MSTERDAFEAWMKKRGTPLVLEHPQAFDAWKAAKAELATELRPAIEMGRELLAEIGGCDHSVGICACNDIAALDQADAALKRLGHNEQGERPPR